MASRARLSQDRSRLRRDQLLDAAIALFAEGGTRIITHRAVAAKAGLPPATTTYYFTSIDELIAAALSRHIELWLRDLKSLTARPVEGDVSLADANGLIVTIFAARSTDMVGLQLSIYLAAARNPGLRSTAAEALEVLATKMLRQVGTVDPESVSHSVVSVILGSAISRLSERHSNEDEVAMLYRSIRSLVVAASLSEDEIAEKLQRLKSGPEATRS